MRGLAILLGLNFQTVVLFLAAMEIVDYMNVNVAPVFGKNWNLTILPLFLVIILYNWYVALRWLVKKETSTSKKLDGET